MTVFASVKKWLGLGGEEEPVPASREAHDGRSSGQKQQRAGRAAAAAQSRQPPLTPPVLTEVAEGQGGIQGLDWFQQSMLRDSHGDCAQTFLEEPLSRQQREREQKQRQGQQGQPSGSSERPAVRQQKAAVLQNCSCRAKVAGPSDMLVDRGNVYVVPHGN
ncbi:hypothetical protein CHLNCDRAFT_142616 [Chlorella variabilis]|uniref:Uncharacterized protein n=1 Tax=Chlorella variabilis TaxID=554065 RepID=E1ZU00_CHLVA|nr:hypothetical protein CHLNCDRAFT_142616 [Chlorella variabilis]EFN50693.1 hypothetical protein CHLNCDRAFT_142616 [Chlorella variabilis]|eukprot:XP_005842805.1 hypothetical protein CHLNCDRAFT_142616 [Chlorella variabilis]